MPLRAGGFTLIELIVVVTIIGILAAYGVPVYLKSVETSKADFAIATLKTIGSSNRLFALDNNGTYVTGVMSTSCGSYGSCNGLSQNVCNLMGCKYLVVQDWTQAPYTYTTCDAAVAGACATLGSGSNKYLAAAVRVTGPRPGTTIAPFSTWGYTMDINGIVDSYNSAPLPAGY